MKTTLLIVITTVITALFALAADPEPKKPATIPTLDDSQKLKLSRIESDFLAQKTAILEAEVAGSRAMAAMKELQALHTAAANAIKQKLKVDAACVVTKTAPEPATQTAPAKEPDWVISCPTPPPAAPVAASKTPTAGKGDAK